MTHSKIQEQFYPLTASIAEVLRKAKLTATEWRIWSYLAQLDPFGDRYQDFDYLSVMSACDCSKSSFYRAIAKFQEFNIFDFQCRGWSMRNLVGVSNFSKNSDREPPPEPKPAQCQDWENSLNSGKVVSKLGKLSQNCENQSLETPENQQSASPKTLQKINTNQTRGEEQNNFQEEEVNQERKLIKLNYVAQSESKQENYQKSHKDTTESIEKKNIPARVVQKDTKIPEELLEKLRELGIPIDSTVTKAIQSHHISQAYGAAAHVENTYETIRNTKSVFLYQISHQEIDTLGARLPEIGAQMREINQSIDEEIAAPEYQQVRDKSFASIREILNQIGVKKNERFNSP